VISAFASNVIFYQSEYHQQGYALLLFLLLIYTIIQTSTSNSRRWRFVQLLAIASLMLSHYFSPLLIAPVLGAVAIGTYVRAYIGILPRVPDIIAIKWTRLVPAFLTGIGIIYLHFVTPTVHLESYLALALASEPNSASLSGARRPLIMSIVRSTKWVVLLFALPAITYSVWKGSKKELVLSGFIGAFLLLGIIGQYGFFISVGRTVTFYASLVGVMVAITIYWLTTTNRSSISTKHRQVSLALFFAAVLIITAFGGHFVPAYYLQTAEENPQYWNSNELPDTNRYPPAGNWIENYGPSEYTIIGTGRTRGFAAIAPAYWGRGSTQPGVFGWYDGPPDRKVEPSRFIPSLIQKESTSVEYFLLNIRYNYGNRGNKKDKIYSNGELVFIE
jgi:hypothetical protein